ncbi:hypothetical protein J6590_039486 [Homalodisca vitripennis]|nr:hypothetical protein J6590_039486 [Homalodisca vitripennis]
MERASGSVYSYFIQWLLTIHKSDYYKVTFLLSGGLCQGPIDDDIDIGGYTQAVPNKFALVRTFCRLRNPVMSVIE